LFLHKRKGEEVEEQRGGREEVNGGGQKKGRGGLGFFGTFPLLNQLLPQESTWRDFKKAASPLPLHSTFA
jgi:hypothetical protein